MFPPCGKLDPKSGFADLTDKEKQVIVSYSNVQFIFMATKGFYDRVDNAYFRKHAVMVISKLAKRIEDDAFIPYLAMNYFDRFFSIHSRIMENVKGKIDTVKVHMIAIGCLTIAAKMRIKDFSIEHFLKTYSRFMDVRLNHHMVLKTELLILRELYWEMLSVTPFTFLNYYYPYFKSFGGFKRRCINEIIVQAQGEDTFVRYFPSVMAISAFLAASIIAYPDRYREIIVPFTETDNLSRALQYKVVVCVDEMVDLCNRLGIQIETPESGTPSALNESQQDKESGIPSTSELKESQQDKESGIPSTSELKKSQQDKGKGVMVVDASEEEDDDEEEGTPLMGPNLDMSKMMDKSKALKIPERVEEENKKLDKGETSRASDKARVEGIIPQQLEKGKAVEGEKIEGYISEPAELEVLKNLMNFEVKWPEETPTVPEPPKHNRSKLKGKILRTAKKVARGNCKIM